MSSPFKPVLQSTGSSQDVTVVGVVVPLARHLDGAKLLGRLHVSLAFPLNVVAVAPLVVTLNNRGGIVASGTAAKALQLRYGT